MGGMWAMVAIPTTVVAVHAFIRTQRRASAYEHPPTTVHQPMQEQLTLLFWLRVCRLVVAFVLASAAILVAEVTVTRVPVWQPTSTVNVTVFGIPAYLILAEVCHAPLLVSLLPRCSTDFLCASRCSCCGDLAWCWASCGPRAP